MNSQRKLMQLVSEVEELIAQLGAVQSPEVERLRDQVNAAIAETRDALNGQGKSKVARIRRASGSLVDYVQDNPWLSVITVATLAFALGHISGASQDTGD